MKYPATAAEQAHAGRPPQAREIVPILMVSYAARLRRRLKRIPFGRWNANVRFQDEPDDLYERGGRTASLLT